MKKIDIKNGTGVDTLKFAKKAYLESLKSKVDKLDFDKLKTVPTDLRKLSNLVDNNVERKKSAYEILIENINTTDAISTSKSVKKMSTLQKFKKLSRKYLCCE